MNELHPTSDLPLNQPGVTRPKKKSRTSASGEHPELFSLDLLKSGEIEHPEHGKIRGPLVDIGASSDELYIYLRGGYRLRYWLSVSSLAWEVLISVAMETRRGEGPEWEQQALLISYKFVDEPVKVFWHTVVRVYEERCHDEQQREHDTAFGVLKEILAGHPDY